MYGIHNVLNSEMGFCVKLAWSLSALHLNVKSRHFLSGNIYIYIHKNLSWTGWKYLRDSYMFHEETWFWTLGTYSHVTIWHKWIEGCITPLPDEQSIWKWDLTKPEALVHKVQKTYICNEIVIKKWCRSQANGAQCTHNFTDGLGEMSTQWHTL